MKFKNKVIGLGIGIVLTSGLVLSIPQLKLITKVNANTETQQIAPQNNINTSVEVALLEFSNLEDFNERFAETVDEQWMVPDLSSLGSEDSGKTHGWTTTTSEEVFLQEVTLQEEPQDYIDGATAGDIRKALADRDAETK